MAVTVKGIVAKFRSKDLETVIVDLLIRQAGKIFFTCLGGTVVALGVMVRFIISHRTSFAAYMPVSRWWALTGAFVLLASIAFRFTPWSRLLQRKSLVRGLRRYTRFNHAKEMEVVSRIHSRTRGAAMIALLAVFVALPLLIMLWYDYGIAVVVDVVNNVKGAHIQPNFGPPLLFYAYGIVLGLAFDAIIFMLESARLESLLLSPTYRRKMIHKWRAALAKVRVKLRHKRRRSAATAAPQCKSTAG